MGMALQGDLKKGELLVSAVFYNQFFSGKFTIFIVLSSSN